MRRRINSQGQPKLTKVTILGNCQAIQIKMALEDIVVDLETIYIGSLVSTSAADLISTIERSNLVFSQNPLESLSDKSGIHANDLAGKFVRVPSIVFNGYHPDCIYLPGVTARNSGLPTDYHSAIGIAGFLSGRSVEETARLYNAYIFSACGYFDAFERARIALEHHLKQCGVGLEGAVGRWSAGKPFMHTINHPHIAVIQDVILAVTNNIGLSVISGQGKSLEDPLGAGMRWPVHPLVARRQGVPGETIFRFHPQFNTPDASLECYLDMCFKYYRGRKHSDLKTNDVSNVMIHID